MIKKQHYILFGLIIVGMLLPALQKAFQFFPAQPLFGDFELAEEPVFSTSSWLDGSFQRQYNNYLEAHIGFHPSLVRFNNQIDFSLFRKANADGVIIGKDDCLYEYDYIRAYTGKDFVGERFIAEKMNRLKFLQTYLKDSLDIDLVLVFEPGKASFYPEYIPDRYLETKNPKTNYTTYLKTARDLNIKTIDLNQYFLDLKEKSDYPLFPKYGTHWSIYGMSFAADTLLKTIRSLRNINMSEVIHDGIFTSGQALRTDNDVEKSMNLLLPLPLVELAYPVFEFVTDTTADKPMVLTVADSYYWNFFNTHIPKNVFANEAFWYFNARVYPDYYLEPTYVHQLDLKKEVEKQDVIFLMVTERFLYKIDWGFIDDVYKLYTPEDLQSPVYERLGQMLKEETWFVNLLKETERNDQSLDSVLWNEAKYRLRKTDKNAYLHEFGATYYEEIIGNDSKWSAGIAAKAEKKNISFEEMLSLDAAYMFKKNHPDLFKQLQNIRQREEVIRNDSLLFDQAKSYAAYYCCQLDKAIRFQAGLRFEDGN